MPPNGLPFEFALEGSPVSQQTRRRARLQRWAADVRSAAERYGDGSPPVDSAVMVNIVYIFDGVQRDLDNIVKPILDAMKGLVYSNDSQVTDLICRKRRRQDDLQFALDSSIFDDFLTDSNQFLYVRVGGAPDPEVPL